MSGPNNSVHLDSFVPAKECGTRIFLASAGLFIQTWLTYTVTVAVYSCTATIIKVTCLFSKVRLARMQVQCEHVVIHKLAARVNAPMSVYDMSAAG